MKQRKTLSQNICLDRDKLIKREFANFSMMEMFLKLPKSVSVWRANWWFETKLKFKVDGRKK